MKHTYKCLNCGDYVDSYCFEYMDYTKEGWETRKKQLDSGLCIPCYGVIPERGVYRED